MSLIFKLWFNYFNQLSTRSPLLFTISYVKRDGFVFKGYVYTRCLRFPVVIAIRSLRRRSDSTNRIVKTVSLQIIVKIEDGTDACPTALTTPAQVPRTEAKTVLHDVDTHFVDWFVFTYTLQSVATVLIASFTVAVALYCFVRDRCWRPLARRSPAAMADMLLLWYRCPSLRSQVFQNGTRRSVFLKIYMYVWVCVCVLCVFVCVINVLCVLKQFFRNDLFILAVSFVINKHEWLK